MCKGKIFQQKNRHKRRQKRGSGQPVPHSVEADVQLQVSRVGHHHLHLRPGKIVSRGGNEKYQTFDPVPTFMLMCTVVLKGFVCTTVMSLSLGMLCATWIALLCGSAWLMSTTCRRRAQVLKRKQLTPPPHQVGRQQGRHPQNWAARQQRRQQRGRQRQT